MRIRDKLNIEHKWAGIKCKLVNTTEDEMCQLVNTTEDEMCQLVNTTEDDMCRGKEQWISTF